MLNIAISQKKIFSLARITYIVLLHLVLIFLVFKTDFIPKVMIKVKMISVREQFSENMRTYHESADGSNPEKYVVFLGDSITEGLRTAPYSINYGLSGETTDGLLRSIPSYKHLPNASTIFLMIGINDLWHGSANGLSDRYKKINSALPPKTRLIWSSIMPAQGSSINFSELKEANETIKTLCQNRENCIFVDTWKVFTDKNGKIIQSYFNPDGVHLSPDGYEMWISTLKQAMHQSQKN